MISARILDLGVADGRLPFAASIREAERELERAPAAEGLLDLTYADTHRFPPPEWVVPTFVEAASGGGMTYTPYRGDAGVRATVAGSVSSFLGVPVDADSELILTPGSQSGLFAALAAIVDVGDTVALADPDYMSSERIVRLLGGDVRRVPLLWEDGAAPALDLDELRRALREGARVVLLSHPNNPTGAVYPPAVVAAIAAEVAEADGLLIVDELYSRLIYDDLEFAHLIAQPGLLGRCVTLLGPSKTESMSGYRLGVAVGPPEVVDAMEDVLGAAVLRAPAYAQHLLAPWLRDDRDFVATRIAEYQRLRDWTVDRLNESGLVEVVPARGTAYMFPDVSRVGADDQAIAIALKTRAGLLVNPGYQFGSRGTGHFRLCFAQDETAWETATERLLETLRELADESAARRGARKLVRGRR